MLQHQKRLTYNGQAHHEAEVARVVETAEIKSEERVMLKKIVASSVVTTFAKKPRDGLR